MKLSRSGRVVFLVIGNFLAVLLGCLGVETSSSNLLGWCLIVIGVGYGVGGTIYFWVERERHAATPGDPGELSLWMIIPGFVAIFFGPPVEYLYLSQTMPRGDAMQLIGLALVMAAFLLRIWARLSLRELYTGRLQVKEDHRLVQAGPYHFIRHPGYAGFVLIALGLAVGYSSLVGLLAIPMLLLPGMAFRMLAEERLLTQHFGDAYRQYAARTRRLLPGIW